MEPHGNPMHCPFCGDHMPGTAPDGSFIPTVDAVEAHLRDRHSGPVCSICRQHHGPEIQHACE